jgi:glycine cleavage system aminomethyltransferase T
MDASSIARFEVSGPQAATLLRHIGIASHPLRNGRSRTSLMLEPSGRLCGVVLVSCLEGDRYYLTASPELEGSLRERLWRHRTVLAARVCDLNDEWGTLLVIGEKSSVRRAQAIARRHALVVLKTPWPDGTGHELHGPSPRLAAAYAELREGGAIDFGWRSAEAMRISNGQARWGNDLGHGDAVSIERLRLIELAGDAPIPGGLEPVLAGDRLIGLTTSGAYDPQRRRVVAIASLDGSAEPLCVHINERSHEIRGVEARIRPIPR